MSTADSTISMEHDQRRGSIAIRHSVAHDAAVSPPPDRPPGSRVRLPPGAIFLDPSGATRAAEPPDAIAAACTNEQPPDTGPGGLLCPGEWVADTDEDTGAQLALTVTGTADNAEPVDDFDAPPRGKRFVAVRVLVRNVGECWYRDDLSRWAQMLDDAHQPHEQEPVQAGGPALGEVRLAPGDQRAGTIAFALAGDRMPAELQLRIGYAGSLCEWTLAGEAITQVAPPTACNPGPMAVGCERVLPGAGRAQCAVTVERLLDPAPPADEYEEPPRGHRLVAVQLRIENTGAVALTDSVTRGALLVDDSDHQYEPSLVRLDLPALDEVRLRAGGLISGYIGFAMPGRAVPRLFQLTLDEGQADVSGEWLLADAVAQRRGPP